MRRVLVSPQASTRFARTRVAGRRVPVRDPDPGYDAVVSEQHRPAPAAEHTAPLERRAAKPIAAIVRVEGATAEPTSVELDSGSCVVGSAPGCDIVVSDRAVSRTHVELMLAPEGVSVRDLGSSNGTFFHGQRIEKMVLGLGGRLTIGSATLVVEADGAALKAEPSLAEGHYRDVVGRSPASRHLFGLLTRLEGSLATVLVEGESGVGKERVAQALHAGSSVHDGPLITVNCGAFPRELIASELFGHRRGAFSGAFADSLGAFQSADGGTLFLDEVGELPLELQPMLLRALELGEVRALGEDQPQHVKVRIIAATNRDLEEAMRQGTFRQDLFYRLAVVRLSVPPLRERTEDIDPLAQHFAEQAGLPPLDDSMLADLRDRAWHGNARELRNAIVSYAALGALPDRPRAPLPEVAALLSPLLDMDRPFIEQKDAIVDTFSRLYLDELLERAHGNQSEAARMSGLNRTYLGRLLSKYGVEVGRKSGKK
jgi:DNA-binding NtrC family response regulator